MIDADETRTDAPVRVWETFAEDHTALVGTPCITRPMRPMTLHPSVEECALWFFTHAEGDFADEVGEGGPAHLVAVSADGRTQIALVGRIEPSRSAHHVERYWSPMVAAWFPGGRDDPGVLLMRFTPQIGRIWRRSGGAIAAGWEIAKASLTGERPDLGAGEEVVFTPRI